MQHLSRFRGKGKSQAEKRKWDNMELSCSGDENEPRMKKKFIAKLNEVLEEIKYNIGA